MTGGVSGWRQSAGVTPTDGQTGDDEEGQSAGDAFTETFVISVTRVGSHAQPVNTVKLLSGGERDKGGRGGERERRTGTTWRPPGVKQTADVVCGC